MELLLNTVWLLLSGAAMAAWLWHLRRSSANSASRSAVALACAALLLFPMISLTDDLHTAQFAVEDSSVSKRLLKTAPGVSAISDSGFGPHAVLFLSTPDPTWVAYGRVTPEQRPVVASSPRSPVEGRGPPLA